MTQCEMSLIILSLPDPKVEFKPEFETAQWFGNTRSLVSSSSDQYLMDQCFIERLDFQVFS